MNRAELRELVRFYLDDMEGQPGKRRWSDDRINYALKLAAQSVCIEMMGASLNAHLVTNIATNLDGQGRATVPLNEKILNIYMDFGDGTTIRIKGGMRSEKKQTAGVLSGRITVDIILRNEFPTDDFKTVEYCQKAAFSPLIDQLVGLRAATNLKVLEAGEDSSYLVSEYNRTLSEVKRIPISPTKFVLPYNNSYNKALEDRLPPVAWYLDSATIIQVYA